MIWLARRAETRLIMVAGACWVSLEQQAIGFSCETVLCHRLAFNRPNISQPWFFLAPCCRSCAWISLAWLAASAVRWMCLTERLNYSFLKSFTDTSACDPHQTKIFISLVDDVAKWLKIQAGENVLAQWKMTNVPHT